MRIHQVVFFTLSLTFSTHLFAKCLEGGAGCRPGSGSCCEGLYCAKTQSGGNCSLLTTQNKDARK